MRIVHEGRSGFIEIEGKRYTIEHIEGGRFVIHVPGGQRHALLAQHLAVLQQLVHDQPLTWSIENRSRQRGRRA